MGDYVTLIGAEQVSSAGHAMRSAAEDMQRAASSMADSVFQLRQLTEDWRQIAGTIDAAAAAIRDANNR